jgi:hypothetical protein
VPLDTFISNIRSFIEAILRSPSTSTTKILLITPPPINVREAIPGNIKLKCETIEKSLTQLEFECRESLGFKTWVSKLQYAEAIVRLANEFRENGEARVAVVDFWRAIMNYGLGQEGRGNLEEGEIDTSGSGKWPGCGLPEAKEFGNGVFTDRLHLGEKGYWVLSAEVLKVLDDKWPGLL